MTPEPRNFRRTENNGVVAPTSDEEKQLWLQHGWPLHFDLPEGESDPSDVNAKRTIKATWLEALAASNNHSVKVKIDISNAVIDGPLDFKYFNFECEVSIVNSEFTSPCDFSFATFHHNASFLASHFNQPCIFRGVQAKCDFIIIRAHFKADSKFIEMNVGGGLNADGASFKDVDFTLLKVATFASFNPIHHDGGFIPVRFMGESSFYGAEFSVIAVFRGAQFMKEAKFEGIKVLHRVSFDTFEHEGEVIRTYLNNANFERAQFQGEATFIGVIFNDYTTFEHAQFCGNANFSASKNQEEKILTIFNGKVSFSEGSFKNHLFFNGVQFKEKTDFRRIRVEGMATFSPRRFNDIQIPTTFEAEVNFTRAVMESYLQFIGSQFLNKADFAGIRVGDFILFSPAYGKDEIISVKFGGNTTFAGAKFQRAAFFDSTYFMRDANFIGARFEGDVFFNANKKGGEPTCFYGRASFISTYFGGDAFFNGAQFNAATAFFYAQFNRAAYFSPLEIKNEVIPVHFIGKTNFGVACFKGEAKFQGVHFKGDVSFKQSRIEEDIDFGPATLGGKKIYAHFYDVAKFDRMAVHGDAIFSGARFMGKTNFGRVYIGGNAFFNSSISGNEVIPIQFDNDVEFSGSHFISASNFIGTQFKADAIFESVRFDSDALFLPKVNGDNYVEATFEGAAVFSSSIFEQQADFRGADFKDRADFRRAEVNGAALFIGAVFTNGVTFREAKFNIAIFREDALEEAWSVLNKALTVHVKDRPNQFVSKVDMRGFSYERIYAKWREIFNNLLPYDRQPYIQLEKTLRLAGNDKQADHVYLARRRHEGKRLWAKVLRRNENKKSPLMEAIKDLPIALFDKSEQLLFNYGIRPYRLILLSVVVICLGTIVFSSAGAVMQRDREARAKQIDKVHLSKSEAFNVSLHQFIPVVEITPGDEWEPSGNPMPILGLLNLSFAGYATIHKIAGAILVPLGIAALTGLLKRREK